MLGDGGNVFQIPYVLTATDSLSISTPFDIPGGATSQIQSYDGKVSPYASTALPPVLTIVQLLSQ